MRYIDRNKFREKVETFGWEVVRQAQINAMEGFNLLQKKNHINNNPLWNQLQPIMLTLSNNKCWYSEAPIGNSDFEVDHFRPKGKSKQKNDFKDPNSKSTILKENGYWWLAYEWSNYRLSGGLANKIRRDRLGDCEETHGKGDYFPLDCNDVGRIADDEENINCEIPILLDPFSQEDVSLLAFDSNGEAISAGLNDYENERVLQSIFYYHLDLEQLNKERLMCWKDCEREILEIKELIDSAPDERARRLAVASCFRRLMDYVKNPDRPYSSTVKSCVRFYSKLEGFNWLDRFVTTILI
ncbi:hypothetical protein FIA58_006055 [Flavobacterium jejuense]|uniref:HNH nuclease domain-containing protein n=1 Tax=Flavobacterium jejuense TaxID=1544455 RepID=A0ABX0IN59_9FLAO|nr:hypothetical protein [Flavobacterium jejuense]NHN25237.1 hypothetical protein [Flavobacterium jejuense]